MASKYKGYMGKALDIDLTTGKIGEYDIKDEDRKLFLGGKYLSTKILWDELKSGIDPLSPDNIIVIMTGPLCATGAPSSSRYDISAKSPLTGAIGHSNSGGNFGMFLKKAGWDAALIRGKSDKPVYIDIADDKVTIKDASHIWGLNTHEAQEAMGQGGNCGTMTIGPAGEHLVKFATIVSQERSHGRTGMGAVMGSKNLKGMVARGTYKIPLYKEEAFRNTVKSWIRMIKKHPATGEVAPKFGTAAFLTSLSLHNALPTKNFTAGYYDRTYQISGERLAEEFLVKNYGCSSCPIRCGRVVNINGKDVKGPEYEILALMGSNLLIDDMEAIINWNYELDLLGMDAITTGTLLGFAAELHEKGLWDSGVEFGKKDNISEILVKIANREGVGNDLAEGVKRLSEKFGGKDFAAHVKGLELAAYEPRAAVGHALGYAVAPRGACHLDGGYMIYMEVTGPMTLLPHHYRSKPAWTIMFQEILGSISAAGQCLFTSWTMLPPAAFQLPGNKLLSQIVSKLVTYAWPQIDMSINMPPWMMSFHMPGMPHSKAISLATGMNLFYGSFLQVGKRGYTMERLYNLREGLTKKDDTLPKRFTDEELIKGDKKSKVNLKKLIPKYYRLRGWDKNGIPKKSTLKKLGMNFVDIDELKKKIGA